MVEYIICFAGVLLSAILMYIASGSISLLKRRTKPYYCGEKGEALRDSVLRGKVEYFILYVVLEFIPIVVSLSLLTSLNYLFISLSLGMLSLLLFLILYRLEGDMKR
ncbi:MAG: hypothetical protein B6U94_04405 [Thermofilum sp. ex4484_79]|nr:MAG: hypothetical protein B6U94_04405 [Thermofilum sp. ex4484_79]